MEFQPGQQIANIEKQAAEHREAEEKANKLALITAKYPGAFEVKIPVDSEGKEFAYGYCKKLERSVMLMMIGKLKDNFVEGLELLWKNSVIPEETDARMWGDNSDDDFYFAAVLKMEELLTFKKAEVKKI